MAVVGVLGGRVGFEPGPLRALCQRLAIAFAHLVLD
jgi:hypothetical protein